MYISVKKLLLLDGLGAVLTAAMCLVVARFEAYFGMPKLPMVVLSCIAFGFALFSICNYLFLKRGFQRPLRRIMFANIAYCVATGFLILWYVERLTALGLAYFFGEILVVSFVVRLEYINTRDAGGMGAEKPLV